MSLLQIIIFAVVTVKNKLLNTTNKNIMFIFLC